MPFADKVKAKEMAQIYRERNREKARQTAREWYNSENGQNLTLLNQYGISLEDYKKLLEKQGGGCAICGTKPENNVHGTQKKLCIDHDHSCCSGTKSCGKCIRGILCHKCNTAVGLLGDTAEGLKKAIAYLEDNR